MEEELISEMGNDLKKVDSKKIDPQEMEQNGKDSEHGKKVNKQNEESEEDKIELVLDKFESKGDKNPIDNKEEGDNFNLVSNSQDLDKDIDWFQEAQPDNILDQGLSEISLVSPAKVKLTFLEEKGPKWGDEEDIRKALGKSETKQEEEEEKNTRYETTESEASGFNFESETEGELKGTRKKGRNKAKRKRIVVDSDMSKSDTESLEKKNFKTKKGKVTRKQTQKKNTKKGNKKDISHILVDSEEDVDENKKVEDKDKEGEVDPIMGNNEVLNTTSLQKEDKGDKSDIGDNDTIKLSVRPLLPW
ncbi:uncharacterized protein LOC131858777 [Cryptomeria japonica]|uniref:uncharacterized protein LOC131858777 n=1 Tax=Cryptomeria japonica TaxID=3369 RepID=UPI0027DA542D|nr:uncharacterized protein LOC131858777 [Cryptomeria japonica]